MTADKPRYSRVSDILDLAIFMSSKIQGVTVNEISERYNVSRRTAERISLQFCVFCTDGWQTAFVWSNWKKSGSYDEKRAGGWSGQTKGNGIP